MKKKALAIALACVMAATMLAGCSGSDSSSTATTAAAEAAASDEDAAAVETETAAAAVDTSNLSEVQQIIKQAESMTMEELAQKAIEESNGATFYGVGNSSHGASAVH